jgi:thioredoxin-like negative regulator of GroEL
MIDRILILLAFGALVLAATIAIRAWTRARLGRLQANSPTLLWQALRTTPDGRPTIVTFSSPSCGVCRTTQAPVLQSLQQTLGDEAIRVMKVDVASEPEVAATFGVLTVPTTVVLTANGQLLTANHGFAPLTRLIEQVQRAAIG